MELTRKPVELESGGVVYLDEKTGEYFEEPEAVDPDAKRVCLALTEPLPSPQNPGEGKWAFSGRWNK